MSLNLIFNDTLKLWEKFCGTSPYFFKREKDSTSLTIFTGAFKFLLPKDPKVIFGILWRFLKYWRTVCLYLVWESATVSKS